MNEEAVKKMLVNFESMRDKLRHKKNIFKTASAIDYYYLTL